MAARMPSYDSKIILAVLLAAIAEPAFGQLQSSQSFLVLSEGRLRPSLRRVQHELDGPELRYEP